MNEEHGEEHQIQLFLIAYVNYETEFDFTELHAILEALRNEEIEEEEIKNTDTPE